MSGFEFATAQRIIFGEGKLREMLTIAPEFGHRALVVVGGAVERAKPLFDLLDEANVAHTEFSVTQEPDIALVQRGVATVNAFAAEMVISFGGGAAIDTGKAISALATNPGSVLDYLEIIGKGKKLIQPPLPFVAIPTTAGTGAEVTRNAVIASPEHKLKVSLRSPLMLPKVALVDPELTYGLPKAITAYTGMDALTQCIEPFVSNAANPLTDAICHEGIRIGSQAIYDVYGANPDQYEVMTEARHGMALTSLFGGLALANAKLGAVHGFAGVLGGMYDAPHGALCAALLPPVIEVNVRALQSRDNDIPALRRYTQIAILLTKRGKASGSDVAPWLAELVNTLEIPPLRTYGIQREDFPTIVEHSAKASSMKGNPIVLTTDELTEILDKAW